MADQGSLNQLLQWGIEHSNPDANPDTAAQTANQRRDPNRGLDANALAELLGGPSDADRMKGAMTAIVAPLDIVDLENKLIAWDNFEQLIEGIDNANNLDSLGLWPPLIQQLDNPEAQMRRMAAWCISSAVQNNVKCQEKLLGLNVMEKLVGLATEDPEQSVRKKATTALSSEVRNFQPGLDELMRVLPKSVWGGSSRLDAGDMDAVDEVIGTLRQNAARA
ncbi:Hsp70 nucleotide exchange factor [Neohortaea acidophila]|uniref:Hsp70 nucleotide exchange factor n=1 Tax=Neohortaea acidophila TaxID=245834 RepID=A0A6A6PG29_9PEZI|nr:Hsp70 nucleotide exchange factor [Neohortaea acidophila]KAF2478691.1 Hsp70 nucleotide exchange factor [Neohortaea acidophila]